MLGQGHESGSEDSTAGSGTDNIFNCNSCGRKFNSINALCGHQNAHRHEHASIPIAKLNLHPNPHYYPLTQAVQNLFPPLVHPDHAPWLVTSNYPPTGRIHAVTAGAVVVPRPNQLLELFPCSGKCSAERIDRHHLVNHKNRMWNQMVRNDLLLGAKRWTLHSSGTKPVKTADDHGNGKTVSDLKRSAAKTVSDLINVVGSSSKVSEKIKIDGKPAKKQKSHAVLAGSMKKEGIDLELTLGF